MACNSALVEAFFSTEIDYQIANGLLSHLQSPDGTYRMTKAELANAFGISDYGIHVANRSIADGYDDYAERTFIWGGTRSKLADDATFVIDSSGMRSIENMAIINWGNDDFDFVGSDLITNLGRAALEHAIDPSAIGVRVKLQFTDYDPARFTYMLSDYEEDLAKESSWTAKSLNDLYSAMQEVTDLLWTAGVTKFLHDERPIIYGTIGDDALVRSNTVAGHDLQHPYHISGPWALELHLDEYTGNGILYRAGGGSDLVLGTEHDDVIYGDADNDVLRGEGGSDVVIGGQGADQLFGGSGDDFIFFDAADTHVNGGAGRDSAWAIGPDAIDADMVAWAMEVLSGGSGADTITMSGSDSLMAAGGDGDDVFNLNANNNEGLRIVWGGAGADVINFAVDYAVEWFDRQVGILVVNVIGLTVDSFATLTPDMLGLDGINLSKIHCIILNPDANDQVQFDGITMNSEDYEFFNDDIGSGPNGSGTNGFFFGTRASPFLGDELVIQGVFVEEGWAEHLFSQDLEYYQVMVTPTSTTVIPSDEFGGMRWSSQQMVWVPFDENDPEVQVNVTRIQSEAAEYFAVLGTEPYLVQEAGDRPEWPWFVAGGNFSGNSLVTDNSISATLTDPPNTLISDWLLVA